MLHSAGRQRAAPNAPSRRSARSPCRCSAQPGWRGWRCTSRFSRTPGCSGRSSAAPPPSLAWTCRSSFAARQQHRTFTLEVVPRAQHYVQACAHTAIFLYWGWYWSPVYEYAYLIVAQLLFAYAFDMLLGWSRRETYTLGFGPFPIILSTNLFLWFKEDWFYLQFLMVAVGFAAKELIRWNKDGRQTHIFNPSSFSLTVFSLALLATGMTGITWGQDIAITQFYPPHMYLFLFLVALPGQILFGVTTMTMSAVVTTYVFGLAYYGITGTYYFYDSYIPIAVFLGMHLLFTDPSTAPRTELGRHDLRRALRLEHDCPVRAPRPRRPADVLRQAPAGAADEPVDPADRPRRPQRMAAAVRSRRRSAGRSPLAAATSPTSRCGRSCSRRSAPRRASATGIAASGFRSGSRPAATIGRAHARISHSCMRPAARPVPGGRATSSTFCRTRGRTTVALPLHRRSTNCRSCCAAARVRLPTCHRQPCTRARARVGWCNAACETARLVTRSKSHDSLHHHPRLAQSRRHHSRDSSSSLACSRRNASTAGRSCSSPARSPPA